MKILREHIATIVVGAVVAVALLAAFLLFGPWSHASGNGSFVVIHDASGEERRTPLTEDATIRVETELGRNTIVVEKGIARMAEADCPHGYCLRQQPISKPGQQIICLPHKLWVEIVDGSNPGGQMDTNAIVEQDATGATVDMVAQ